MSGRDVFPPVPAAAGGATPAASLGCTCARLRRLTRRLTATYDQALAPAGFRVTQYALLGLLWRDGGDDGLPVSGLAERMDMDRTTLSRNLQPLADRGWLRLGPDPVDRRVRRAAVTETGRAAWTAARPHWRQAQAQVEQTLGLAQVAALHQWLDTVIPAFRPPDGDRA